MSDNQLALNPSVSRNIARAINAGRRAYNAYRTVRTLNNYYQVARRAFPSTSSASKRPRTEEMARNGGSGAITYQNDSRVMYRRKRASKRFRRKAKRYAKFCKKVIAAADRRNEKQKVLFVDNVRWTSTANTQNFFAQFLNLYTATGSGAGERDLDRMNIGVGDTSTSNTRTYYRSAHMEVSILNTSANAIYIDLYYYVCRKPTEAGASVVGFLNAGFSDSPTNMGGTTLSMTTYGVTPFQSKEFCSFFKIYRKTSTLLQAGQYMEFALKKSKNFLIESDYIEEYTHLKGKTIGVVAVMYGAPNTATDLTAGQPLAASANVNITRAYTLTSNRPGLVDSGTTLLTS